MRSLDWRQEATHFSLFAARVFLQHASFSFLSTREQPLAQWFWSFTKTPWRLQDLWRLHREARRECYRQWLLEARRSTENTLPSDGLFRKSSTVHREDLAATGWWHLGIERVYATRDQQLHLFLLNSFWIWKERTARERERERDIERERETERMGGKKSRQYIPCIYIFVALHTEIMIAPLPVNIAPHCFTKIR